MATTDLRLLVLCPVCGFRSSTVSPIDAAVALRSFPRRYRERIAAIARLTDDGGDLLDRGVRHVTRAADALRAYEKHLRKILQTDRPVLDDASSAPETHREETLDPSAALRRLEAAADDLADDVDEVPPGDWVRTGVLNGEPVTALDLVRAALHEGVHHLRAIDGLLEAAGARIDEPSE